MLPSFFHEVPPNYIVARLKLLRRDEYLTKVTTFQEKIQQLVICKSFSKNTRLFQKWFWFKHYKFWLS